MPIRKKSGNLFYDSRTYAKVFFSSLGILKALYLVYVKHQVTARFFETMNDVGWSKTVILLSLLFFNKY